MRILAKAAFVGACLVASPALLSPASARDIAPAAGKLVLEDFFRGPLIAEGEFLNTRDGTRRGLKVRMAGHWDGRVLTLREDFTYSDGEKDRKTWRFTKIGQGRYVGTREDVVGAAEVVEDGNDIRLSYTATVRSKGSSYDIRFADRLALTRPRTVLNTAKLSYFFFDVGQVSLTIRQVGPRRRALQPGG
jgi:hypothetical protein